MARIDTSYLNLSPNPVKDLVEFIGRDLPETSRLKALTTSIKSVFKAQNANIQLYYIEGRVYRVDVFADNRKILIASVYYLPYLNQVHIYDNMGNMLLASEKKKVAINNIPYTLDYIGASDKLRNVLLSV